MGLAKDVRNAPKSDVQRMLKAPMPILYVEEKTHEEGAQARSLRPVQTHVPQQVQGPKFGE